MSDLISRKAAIEAINDKSKSWDWKGYSYEDFLNGLHEAEDAVVSLPSADRPKGEWKEIAVRVDGHRAIYYQHDCCCEIYKSQYNFCPHCGTKMEVNHE